MTLILPVENQVREFDARLLLACAAAERELPVLLGSRTYISMAIGGLEPGIFIAKSMRPRSRLMFNIIRDLGHELVAWDEESLVRFHSPEYYAWRFSPDTFRPLSRLFAWGQDDAAMFAAYPGCGGIPVHVVGNPRMDLLRPELRGYFDGSAQALNDRYGDFILVNTNFPFVNHFVPGLNLVLDREDPARARVSRTGEGMTLEFARGLAAHQQRIFDGFRRLLPKLAAWFPDRRIVLRPHPSENHDAWRTLLAGLHNVQVLHEGNVVPWLRACRVLLHNGCTTAVEAALLGIPTVAYRPTASPCFDYPLPNSLSHEAFHEEAVRAAVEDILAGRSSPPDAGRRREILGPHLESLEGPFAADRAMDLLEDEARPGRGWPAQAVMARLKSAARAALKRINLERPGHWNSARYHGHRFPEISDREVNARIGRLRELLGRFEGVRAERTARFIFRVHVPARRERRQAGGRA